MRLLSFVSIYALFVFVSSHFFRWKFPETCGTNWIMKPHNPQQGQPPLLPNHIAPAPWLLLPRRLSSCLQVTLLCAANRESLFIFYCQCRQPVG